MIDYYEFLVVSVLHPLEVHTAVVVKITRSIWKKKRHLSGRYWSGRLLVLLFRAGGRGECAAVITTKCRYNHQVPST